MKKRNALLIVFILILGFIFWPRSLSYRVNLNNFKEKGVTLELIHRNNIVESGTVSLTTDLKKIDELEEFLLKYKSIPTLTRTKNLYDNESYTINIKSEDKILTTMILYNKNFEIITSTNKNFRYNIIGQNIDFKFLAEFVKSLNS